MREIQDSEQYFEASLEKLDLPDAEYHDIEFEDCRFADCNFSGARFRNCKFINCDFLRCNLSLVDISGSRLFGVGFKETKLVGVDWTRADWPVFHSDFELRFQHCVLNDASFHGLTLNELVLENCKLHDVDFREGDFRDSSMTGCDFTHSLFMRSNLGNVDFTESTGYAIDVLNNEIKGAKFSRYEALSLLDGLGVELVD